MCRTEKSEDALAGIRKGIDDVDIRMRELFLERMQLARQVAEVKAKSGDQIYKPDREAVILERRSEGMDEHVTAEYRAFLKRMMEISRKYQYGLTLKMRDGFPFPFETEEEDSNQIGSVEKGLKENGSDEKKSSAGTGRLVMIRPETDLYDPDFCSGKEVLEADSWNQAGEWFETGRVESGAGLIGKIGGEVCDELNLLLLRKHLYIQKCRVTAQDSGRYKLVLFSKRFRVLPDHNRVKIAFGTRNRSGALGSILTMIGDYQVNLTEIHTIPVSKGSGWDYRFFLELEMNLLSELSQALIFQLSQETEEFQILGSYS